MFKFGFHNRVNELFWSSGSRDIVKNYLKTNFENSEIRDFVLTFEILQGESFPKKHPAFKLIHISRKPLMLES